MALAAAWRCRSPGRSGSSRGRNQRATRCDDRVESRRRGSSVGPVAKRHRSAPGRGVSARVPAALPQRPGRRRQRPERADRLVLVVGRRRRVLQQRLASALRHRFAPTVRRPVSRHRSRSPGPCGDRAFRDAAARARSLVGRSVAIGGFAPDRPVASPLGARQGAVGVPPGRRSSGRPRPRRLVGPRG